MSDAQSTGQILKAIYLDGNNVVVETSCNVVRLPAGPDPLSRLPHVARAYLDPEERAAFELLMGLGLGCAGVRVRVTKDGTESS
jgi:hypothetical protein